ncbi:urease accessory protein UreD [Kutzneria viridogrisea]|uniref:Urease accessory protein UreD n=2 Tax=Kutzneria TaxID=43356 RepID=W5VZR1_9PSEU|nr:urease accessory protein UreD [Kutzneria albida]AHH93985.1 Urease accessory protein ureD 1 [Kutzneria albida DSM 43870]MBA8931010.1 urease accessory protein [Kutzneria viridogrisea]
MKASARLVVEADPAGRTTVRELASASPLTLLPQRGRVRRAGEPAVVHLVSSATAPLGGDDLHLSVLVGPGAALRLSGVAASLALPGHRGEPSRYTVHIEVAEGGAVQYLPEPTVITARAWHSARLTVNLAATARVRCREVLVLGRSGERAGRFTGESHVLRDGTALLRQRIEIGDEELFRSAAYLAGRRVLATETVVWGADPENALSSDWWSLQPMARGGSLATALAEDAVAAEQGLRAALTGHPGLAAQAPD